MADAASTLDRHWRRDGDGWAMSGQGAEPNIVIFVRDGKVIFIDNEDSPSRPKRRDGHEARWMANRLMEAATLADLTRGVPCPYCAQRVLLTETGGLPIHEDPATHRQCEATRVP